MEKKTGTDLQKTGNDLVKTLEEVFMKAPHLPANIREILVKITPWFALIFGVLGVLGSLAALLLVLGLTPLVMLGGGVQSGISATIATVLGLVMSVLTVMAFPKLQKMQYSGWMLLFWSELISAVSAVLTVSVGAVLGVVIGFYLLFEIKGHYKK
jgi:hypothetical protein